MQKFLLLSSRTCAFASALAIGAILVPMSASAISVRVTIACAGDYRAYCSEHAISSPGVRQCFRANGTRLSRGCIEALVASGEVSRDEVKRRAEAAGLSYR